MDQEAKKALDVLVLSLESFVSQLQNGTNANGEPSLSFNDENELMQQLGALADTLSHECTKFSMVFTDEAAASAKAAESLSNRLIGMSAALFKLTISMPRTAVGMYFRQSVIDAVVDLFRSLSSLAVAAKEGAANTKAQLKETGTVWESCDRLKALPRNSRELLLRTMTETLNMVNDAFAEFQEMNEEMSAKSSAIEAHDGDANDDDEQPRSLTESEKLQLNACSQLVKAAKAAITKTRTSIEEWTATSKPTPALDDDLTTVINRISPLVDDVVARFHEDVLDKAALNDEMTKLHDGIKELLVTFRKTPYYQEEAHTKWLDIICTAVQHNLTKYHNANESASQ